MKKLLSIIILLIVFWITYLLQANFFSWFTIAEIKPNLFIILVLFVGLYAGNKISIPFGMMIRYYFRYTLMYGMAGLIGGYLDKNFSKDSRITFIIMIIGTTVVLEVISYILNIAIFSVPIEVISFMKVTAIEVLYNVILTIILYPIIQICGYQLENIFKGQKVLTRYF